MASSDDLARALHDRTRIALRVLLAVIVFLFVGAFMMPTDVRVPLQYIQAGHGLSVLACLLVLAYRTDKRSVLAVGLIQVLITNVAIAIGGVASHDFNAALITLVALTLGTATMIPWGGRWQGVSLVFALGAGSWLLATLGAERMDWLRAGGSVLPVLAGTVYVAYAYTRAREDQSRGEGLSRTIIERAATGIAHVSARGRIVEANAALGRMLGVSRGALRGRRFEELLHPADRGRDNALLRELEQRRRSDYQSDRRLLRRDGGVIWARFNVSALPMGRKVERVIMLEDVTASKDSERALRTARAEAERASRAKGEFLATMSHEIRTPMNAILGSSELLADTAMDEQQAQYVDAIRTGGEQLLSLIDDILDFSKIEAGRVELESAVVDLRQLVAKVQGLFVSQARQKRVEFKVTIDDDLPPRLRADATRLQQILSNLVGNAIKFTEGGIVYVRVNKVEPSKDDLPTPKPGDKTERIMVLMEVSDTGVGMGEETLQRLFRPFTQADGSTTRRYGGTGLGLSIVKQLVELMGGEIGAESMPAVGSTFWCRIPFEVERRSVSRPVNAVRRRESTARLAGLRVLVAEDHPMNQMVIARILQNFGCDTDLVDDGIQAVKFAQKNDYAIVLMDVHMPGMDGVEATKMILEAHEGSGPHIIGVTASALKEDRDRCIEAGMRDFLTKPVRREALEAALLDALGRLDETGRFRTAFVTDMVGDRHRYGTPVSLPAAPSPSQTESDESDESIESDASDTSVDAGDAPVATEVGPEGAATLAPASGGAQASAGGASSGRGPG